MEQLSYILSADEVKEALYTAGVLKNYKKRMIFIAVISVLVIVLSFIPTLIYNLFWIIILKRITFDNLVNFNFNEFRTCILTACYTVLAKGIFILFVPQIMCGQENRINDLSYICVLLKTLTTFLYSKYIFTIQYNPKKY